MSKFVDRKDDLATLEEQFQRVDASFVVIYGRRRVGKTALIAEFLKSHAGLYFLATEESEEQNRAAFQRLVADFTENDLLAHVTVDSWDTLFDQLSGGSDGRFVIAIDEFQYLGKSNAAFPSIFQRIWDTILSKRNVMVILCGSLLSLMESQVLSYSSPLYGRRTAQIHMRQIPFQHYEEFYPKGIPYRQLIELYSVTGGVPKYIDSFRGSGDVYSSTRDAVLNANSYLFDEPSFLLSREVGEVGTYFSILRAISFGNRKSGEIAAALNVKQTSLTRYLKTLENMDILERRVPVTEHNPEKSKRGLYHIKDNYLRFWFRFIFPNMGMLEMGHQQEVLKEIKRHLIDAQTAYVYEEVCRGRTWDLAAAGDLPFVPERIGSWWGAPDIELDVVGLSKENGRALFGECKFWAKPVGVGVLEHLKEQAARVLGTPAFKDYAGEPAYVLFSVSGFTNELESLAERSSNLVLTQ